MKILYVATVRSHIGQFHTETIRALKDAGNEVHAAYKDNSADKPGLDLSCIDKVFEVPFERSPYSLQNIKAYKVLKKIIDSENYDVIHCHTPMGATVTRIAARAARKKGTKVFYTVHGFHFYKGASFKNWMFYYPVEKILARYTDVLITINQQDYDLAKNKKFAAGRIEKINGVGVDISKFSLITSKEHQESRNEYDFGDEKFVLLYAADLSYRKNQPMLFRALSRLKESHPEILLLLPGQPILQSEYEKMCSDLGISDMVRFLGYRRDIEKLLAACDCVVSSSRQEGLPLNLIEAAARGKYIIATDVRGNADVVIQSGFGKLIEFDNDEAMAKAIEEIYGKKLINDNAKDAVAGYDYNVIIKQLKELYKLGE